jgi:hypothetical protein
VSAPESLPFASALFAYGPVPGVELFSYFLALVTWVVVALAALFLSPIRALVRRLRRGRGSPTTEPKREPVPPSIVAPLKPEPSVEDPRNHG